MQVDEDVYNRNFETRDIGVPDRYLDKTCRSMQHSHFVVERAYNAFDRRFAENAAAQAARSGTRIDTLGGVHRQPPPKASSRPPNNSSSPPKPRKSARAKAPPSKPAVQPSNATKRVPRQASQASPPAHWPAKRESWLPEPGARAGPTGRSEGPVGPQRRPFVSRVAIHGK